MENSHAQIENLATDIYVDLVHISCCALISRNRLRRNSAYVRPGEITGVSARLACGAGNCGGTLEFHLDTLSSTPIAQVTIPSTGGWQTWNTATGSASSATGTHDLYVVFKAPLTGTGSLGNLNWFQFN
jgi:hypothetical protein